MKELVRCKSCGFVMEKGKLHGKCPACGVPDKMFEPYSEKIAPFRKFMLSLDMHPVLVHFPQAFTATVLLLSLFAMVSQGPVREQIVCPSRSLESYSPSRCSLLFAPACWTVKSVSAASPRRFWFEKWFSARCFSCSHAAFPRQYWRCLLLHRQHS